MSLNFPDAPSVNDEYSAEGRTWTWDGTVWLANETSSAILTVGSPMSYNELTDELSIDLTNYDTSSEVDAKLVSYDTSSEVDTKLANYDTSTEVDNKIADLVDAAPGTLDTLNELAAALGDDENFSTTVANAIGANSLDILDNTDAIESSSSNFTNTFLMMGA
jgi:O6-methylguanine-DNA--protein-cysteine methyltransferase